MYLQINTPKIQVLDENSEVKLQEGVFQTEGSKKEEVQRMKDIPSFEGKNYGHFSTRPPNFVTGVFFTVTD